MNKTGRAVYSDYYVGDSYARVGDSYAREDQTSLLNRVYEQCGDPGDARNKANPGDARNKANPGDALNKANPGDARNKACQVKYEVCSDTSQRDRMESFAMDGNLSYSTPDLCSSYGKDISALQTDPPQVDNSPILSGSGKRKRPSSHCLYCLFFLAGFLAVAVSVAVVVSVVVLYVELAKIRRDISAEKDVSSGTESASLFYNISMVREAFENHVEQSRANSTVLSDSFNSLNGTLLQLSLQSSSTQKILTGQIASSPAASCAEILRALPTSPSGRYWVQSSSDRAVLVYCDMNRTCGGITGGWMRVTQLDMRISSSQCPSGLCLNTASPRTCRKCVSAAGCSLTEFPVPVGYSNVCGKIIAYQVGSTDGFWPRVRTDADGITLSHGQEPRHIWTFVAGRTESTNHLPACPCLHTVSSGASPSSYISNDYFCDTGDKTFDTSLRFFSDDPLWDGKGCGSTSTCCTFNSPPWFYKDLRLTTRDSVAMRVCRNQGSDDEDIAVEQVDIYVQ